MSWAQHQPRRLPVVSGVTRHLFLFLCCISYKEYKLGDSTLKKKNKTPVLLNFQTTDYQTVVMFYKDGSNLQLLVLVNKDYLVITPLKQYSLLTINHQKQTSKCK